MVIDERKKRALSLENSRTMQNLNSLALRQGLLRGLKSIAQSEVFCHVNILFSLDIFGSLKNRAKNDSRFYNRVLMIPEHDKFL